MSKEKIKLVSLELENCKRVSLVKMEVTPKGLTLIGGANQQGKSTILDIIAYIFGGKKYRPTNLQKEGTHANAYMKATLSNGLTVERKGKNAELKVTDPSGAKSGQALLDSFIEELAINLPKFLKMNDADKCKTLLNTLGIESELQDIELRENKATDSRYDANRDYESKDKYANELIHYPDAPKEQINAAELLKKSQAIILKNEKNQELRNNRDLCLTEKMRASKKVGELQEALDKEMEILKKAVVNSEIAEKSAENIEDESTEELQQQLSTIDDTNAEVRANHDKEHALDEARELKSIADKKQSAVNEIRAERTALLEKANLPLPGLSVDKDEAGKYRITYNGKAWDCMSGMEQIRVGTSIVKSLNPECGFILLDGLESFDHESLIQLKKWLENEDLQAIGTRVGTEDCSIIIEDGRIKSDTTTIKEQPKKEKAKWASK